MLFPTHLVAGYLIGRWRSLSTIGVVLGAALPDLLDKPAAMAGMVDLYHTAGHSLFVFAGLVGGWILLAGGRFGMAVWIGWGSHLLLDAVPMVVNGRPVDVQFLFWPAVVHQPAVQLAPIPFAQYYVRTAAFTIEIGILTLAAGVLVTDGWVRLRRRYR